MKQAKRVLLTISEKLTLESMVMLKLKQEKDDLEFYQKLEMKVCTQHTIERIEELENIIKSLNKEYYDYVV